MKHPKIIEMWPTQVELAKDIGISHFAVNKWYKRGKIPPEYWAQLVKTARKRGIYISYEMLVDGVAA